MTASLLTEADSSSVQENTHFTAELSIVKYSLRSRKHRPAQPDSFPLSLTITVNYAVNPVIISDWDLPTVFG